MFRWTFSLTKYFLFRLSDLWLVGFLACYLDAQSNFSLSFMTLLFLWLYKIFSSIQQNNKKKIIIKFFSLAFFVL